MYPIRVGKEFIERGYKVFGLCVTGTPVAEGMESAGIEAFQVKSKMHLIAFGLRKLNRWLKANNVEVIHCHKSGDILVSSLLDLVFSRRVIFTEHMGVTRPKKDIYHRWSYSHVDQVLSISNETLNRNINALPVNKDKIKRLWLGTPVSSNPVKTQECISKLRDEHSIPDTVRLIGTVGRVCLGKGQLDLIKAFFLIADKYPDIHLMVVGGLDANEGSDKEFVETIKSTVSSSQHSDRVHLVGFQKDTASMYSIMDIVCLPYYNEAFGLTAIEAMSAQKAIVAANTGALPEILEGVSLFCTPTDSVSIASNIEIYLNDSTLAETNAKNAYLRAKEHFSMETHVNSLESYYLQ